VQEKLISLEQKVSELTFEIKSLVKTQQDIAETLKEFKNINTSVALIRQDLKNAKDDIQIVFDKNREFTTRMGKLEQSNISQGVKMSAAERIFWLVVTAVVAVAVGMYKGGN